MISYPVSPCVLATSRRRESEGIVSTDGPVDRTGISDARGPRSSRPTTPWSLKYGADSATVKKPRRPKNGGRSDTLAVRLQASRDQVTTKQSVRQGRPGCGRGAARHTARSRTRPTALPRRGIPSASRPDVSVTNWQTRPRRTPTASPAPCARSVGWRAASGGRGVRRRGRRGIRSPGRCSAAPSSRPASWTGG